jgi:hypothetical protein
MQTDAESGVRFVYEGAGVLACQQERADAGTQGDDNRR